MMTESSRPIASTTIAYADICEGVGSTEVNGASMQSIYKPQDRGVGLVMSRWGGSRLPRLLADVRHLLRVATRVGVERRILHDLVVDGLHVVLLGL